MRGYLAFVLHSHIPYVVNHGEWPHGMDWLYEAASESYLPLLGEFNSLISDGIKPNVTIGITPVLAEQMSSERFKEGFVNYLKMKIQVAEKDKEEFTRTGRKLLAELARMWVDFYSKELEEFEHVYKRNLVEAFRSLQDDGHIEIITCAATHGYLPLLGKDESVDAQIRIGVETYKRHFGKDPAGIWLPECAYRPRYRWSSPVKGYKKEFLRKGLEEFLYQYGIKYFIVDKSLILGGDTKGVYLERFEALKHLWKQFREGYKAPEVDEERSIYENYFVSSSGTEKGAVVYGKHEEVGLQVWSGRWGYPGDGRYLEFHKKHFPSGLKYWKVTSNDSDLASKMEYYPDDVEKALEDHSEHFVSIVEKYLKENFDKTGRAGIITCPFDTELFGHWWFEGVRWLGKVLRKLNKKKEYRPITLSEHLKSNSPERVVSLPEGSWGQGGFHYIWLNEWTEWTWREIYRAEDLMVNLADEYRGTSDKNITAILNQIGRELLLLESSDWQFLISTWSARDYAENRVAFHAESIRRLKEILDSYCSTGKLSESDERYLKTLEKNDGIFPDIDFEYWCVIEE
ncbi:MAG: DUF1957 domain-containing protein [Candidatus Marinimicrobia bacterium]|nr:DUF1957 domain-containing protein [Candidatus Neomarinimicrobiota bacterium]